MARSLVICSSLNRFFTSNLLSRKIGFQTPPLLNYRGTEYIEKWHTHSLSLVNLQLQRRFGSVGPMTHRNNLCSGKGFIHSLSISILMIINLRSPTNIS